MLVKIMNKKAGIEIDKLLWVLLGVMGVVAVAILIWNSTGKTKESLNTFQESIKPDKNLFDIRDLSENDIRDLSEKAKEKCASFTTSAICMGNKKQKTGCFWGKTKTTSEIGCLSCTNQKYFDEFFGKCFSYKSVLNTYDEFELLCNLNPCNFQSDKPEKQEERSCFFSTPGPLELRTKENAQCF